jgi:hypothetical protein
MVWKPFTVGSQLHYATVGQETAKDGTGCPGLKAATVLTFIQGSEGACFHPSDEDLSPGTPAPSGFSAGAEAHGHFVASCGTAEAMP